jgi:hypothetical protein
MKPPVEESAGAVKNTANWVRWQNVVWSLRSQPRTLSAHDPAALWPTHVAVAALKTGAR